MCEKSSGSRQILSHASLHSNVVVHKGLPPGKRLSNCKRKCSSTYLSGKLEGICDTDISECT